jgi:Short-chain alcohol dehydrogenase of unknown specificity
MNAPAHPVALVTGATAGIGRAVALRLNAAGYALAIAGRRASELERTRALASAPERMLALACDITDPAQVEALFHATVERFGRLDLLFNNAGIGAPAVGIDELAVEQWQAVIATNLTGAFLCARQAFRIMKAQSPKGGRIINNGSISAQVPRPFSAPYTASKHAITGLTKSLSLDGRRHDIAVSQIDIGNAATEMTERMAAGILQADGRIAVEPRMAVEHVADAVLHMAQLPLSVNVQFMTLIATKMPYIGRG